MTDDLGDQDRCSKLCACVANGRQATKLKLNKDADAEQSGDR
jgi:hypothetical protein